MSYTQSPAQAIRVARGLLKQARATCAQRLTEKKDCERRMERTDRQIRVMESDIEDLKAKRRDQHAAMIEASTIAYQAVEDRDKAEAHLNRCKDRQVDKWIQDELEMTAPKESDHKGGDDASKV